MPIPIKRLIGTSNIRMEILFSAVQNAYISLVMVGAQLRATLWGSDV